MILQESGKAEGCSRYWQLHVAAAGNSGES